MNKNVETNLCLVCVKFYFGVDSPQRAKLIFWVNLYFSRLPNPVQLIFDLIYVFNFS